jgi:hypothetical protein
MEMESTTCHCRFESHVKAALEQSVRRELSRHTRFNKPGLLSTATTRMRPMSVKGTLPYVPLRRHASGPLLCFGPTSPTAGPAKLILDILCYEVCSIRQK